MKIVRAKIEVESVFGRSAKNGRLLGLCNGGRSSNRIYATGLFGEKTTDELRAGLASVQADCKGLIIDLRDNTGGLLVAAKDICDMFLDEGDIVSTRGRDDRIDQLFVAKAGTVISNKVPIVVLINEYSASASEVVAGCMQDRCRATIVGNSVLW